MHNIWCMHVANIPPSFKFSTFPSEHELLITIHSTKQKELQYKNGWKIDQRSSQNYYLESVITRETPFQHDSNSGVN